MLSRIGVLTLILATACAASSKVVTPWRVELETSGGISGRGLGNVALDSDGNLSVTTVTRKSCTYRATSEELRAIEALLEASDPDKWGTYVPQDKCCDRIEYKLSYGNHSAAWIEEPLPMPEDLRKLQKELTALRTKYAAECLK